jgi:hypothetical protein
VYFALAKEFGNKHEGPPIWKLLEESGILQFERRLLKRGEFDIRGEDNGFKTILKVPKEDVDFVTNSSMCPARIWLIKKSTCSSCGKDYDTCPCSKFFDERVVQQIEDAEPLGMFWTNRPA